MSANYLCNSFPLILNNMSIMSAYTEVQTGFILAMLHRPPTYFWITSIHFLINITLTQSSRSICLLYIPSNQQPVRTRFLANSVAECLEGKEQLNNKINTFVASMLEAKRTSRWQSLSAETVAPLRMMSQKKKYHMSTNESPPGRIIFGPSLIWK